MVIERFYNWYGARLARTESSLEFAALVVLALPAQIYMEAKLHWCEVARHHQCAYCGNRHAPEKPHYYV